MSPQPSRGRSREGDGATTAKDAKGERREEIVERKRLRIGVIGVGRRGQDHLRTILALSDRFELAGVCDESESAAGKVAGQFGIKAYSDVDAFLTAVHPDVAVITTSRDTHHLVAPAVAAHGVHMLIETPLAPTRAMMDVIQDAVARAGVIVEVAENMWRRPTERLNAAAISSGAIGKVVRLASFYEPAGGDTCYHTMSLMRTYAGAPVEEIEAFAHASPAARGKAGSAGGESWVQARLFYENGVLGSCTYVTPWTGPRRAGLPRFMTIEGTDGFIVTGPGPQNVLRSLVSGSRLDYQKMIDTRSEAGAEIPSTYYYETDPRIEWQNPYADRLLDAKDNPWIGDAIARAAELDSLHRAVTEGTAPEYGMDEARRDVELSILIIESARLGKRMKARLDPDKETPWERAQREAALESRGGVLASS